MFRIYIQQILVANAVQNMKANMVHMIHMSVVRRLDMAVKKSTILQEHTELYSQHYKTVSPVLSI